MSDGGVLDERGELPRLLLVEDDARLGPVIAEYLAETYDVTLCTDGVAGLDRAVRGVFDVMVVDRRLPGLDGVELVRGVRRARVATPILLLTALGTVPDKVDGLDAGANDYLTKPFEFDELLARLRALRRTFGDDDGAVRIGTWDYYPDSRCIYSPYDAPVVLTPKENDLLRLLAANPRRTFSRTRIAAAILGGAGQSGAVDAYVHYVRRKLEPAVIVTVRGEGYRLGSL
ncbi:response regulator transcription factor [Xylanimonas protaetiae]|uniref:Response regulator transcription factor n=1 Tax=Xylanimonas protaetiae TaxID=2509457 RepID=A0A4P6F4S0_9MICO|nr:response regulator transcription factor [Xylanimonas protaetiae]QAY70930.1 response regulator transcription factor [Xylanimonas protaetiae]